MIFEIIKKSTQQIQKVYLFALPLTILKFSPYEFDPEMTTLSYILLSLLFIVGIISGYYQNFLSLRASKKNLNFKSIKKDFFIKFKRWALSALLVIWKIFIWLIPTLISFAVAGEMFNQNYHILTNLIGVLLLLTGTYFSYKLVLVLIKYSMVGLISIDKKQSTKEILESSENITKNKKTLLVKIGLVTSAISIFISMLAFYLIFIMGLGLTKVSELNSETIFAVLVYILIDNIVTSFSINVHGQTYKAIK